MDTEMREKQIHTVVIGGGQAGLATGYHLMRRDIPHVILDGADRIGDAWRCRWDSLKLFTTGRYSSLPGMPFPGDPHRFPTKDDVGDYLQAYADRFDLPVMSGRKVHRLARNASGFVVETAGERIHAQNVVVAMGTFQRPYVPDVARELSPEIFQTHSARYRSPSELRDGRALVVGAANSGTEVALELSRGRSTTLAGRKVATVPFRIESFFGKRLGIPLVMDVIFHRILTTSNPLGRKAKPKILSKGGMVVRVKPQDLDAAGVERVPRVVGVQDGLPLLADGTVVETENVVWCTGYRPDFRWIDIPVFDDGAKEPRHRRGLVGEAPGLYFVGLFFLYAGSSGIFRGVGRDAAHVVRHLANRGAGTQAAAA